MIAKPPTSNQNRILRTFVSSKNATQAGRKLQRNNSDSNACTTVVKGISNANVQARMCNLFDSITLTEMEIAKKMVNLTNAKKISYFSKDGIVTDSRTDEDGHLQLKALDHVAELRGMKIARSESMNVNVNIDNPDTIATEDLNRMINDLSKEVSEADYEEVTD